MLSTVDETGRFFTGSLSIWSGPGGENWAPDELKAETKSTKGIVHIFYTRRRLFGWPSHF